MRWTILIGSLLALLSCGGAGPRDVKVDEQEIQQTLEQYLPLLARAYATGDTTVLRTHAAQREIATVDKRLGEVRSQGQRLEPTFRGLTLEDVTAWGYANAYATTLEVWDLELYASHGEQPIAETLEQRSRVKYQLRKEDGHWVVLYRELVQTFE